MKLFKLTRKDYIGYDQFDSFVVTAISGEQASGYMPSFDDFAETFGAKQGYWTNDKDAVSIEYIGEAREGMPAGWIFCYSFNAG